LVLNLWAGLKGLTAAGTDLGGHLVSPHKMNVWELQPMRRIDIAELSEFCDALGWCGS
jgi:hypothetical protein